MRLGKILTPAIFLFAATIVVFDIEQVFQNMLPPKQVDPNWAAISTWPDVEADVIEAQPDPNRRVTAIVIDDSGSMGMDIRAAKTAVVGALNAMTDTDRVAVLALNSGTLLSFTSVKEARGLLPARLAQLQSDGTTPLTRAVKDAQKLLANEASTMRGFGTFRLIVTTDGKADNEQSLTNTIQSLAQTTPIQLTTIGIGIEGRHVLRRDGIANFIDVENVSALEGALKAAVAENTDFTAITDFGASGG